MNYGGFPIVCRTLVCCCGATRASGWSWWAPVDTMKWDDSGEDTGQHELLPCRKCSMTFAPYVVSVVTVYDFACMVAWTVHDCRLEHSGLTLYQPMTANVMTFVKSQKAYGNLYGGFNPLLTIRNSLKEAETMYWSIAPSIKTSI